MTNIPTYSLIDSRAFTLTGPGCIENCACHGVPAVRLVSPNVLPVPSEGHGVYTRLTWHTEPQDWSGHNRLSLKVYPDCPGLQCVTLEIALCSGGQLSVSHQVQLSSGTWNTAVLNLTGMERASVTQVIISRKLTGRQQNMSAVSMFYFGEISLDSAQSGVHAAALPKALPWREIAENGLAYLRARRCGTEVPGVHMPCHSDCFTVHPDGRRVFLSGGWHDLGDLSHSLEHTAQAACSLMALAQAIPEDETALRGQLLDEARYGLEWMQFTRFRDGYRCVEARIPAWTDEVIGTADDVLCEAHNDPYANFCAAAVSAQAYAAFKEEDAVFALYCLNCARDDFRFAYEHMYLHEMRYGVLELKDELPLHAQALCAAAALYRAGGDPFHLELAVRFAGVVCACLNRETGCFCADSTLSASCSEETAVSALRGLSLLAAITPDHPQGGLWRETLSLCAAHLKAAEALPHIAGSMTDPHFFETLLTHACVLSAAAHAAQDDEQMNASRACIRYLLGENPFAVSFVNGVCGGSLPIWDAYCAKHNGGIRMGLSTLADGSLCPAVTEDCCRSELMPLARLFEALADCLHV